MEKKYDNNNKGALWISPKDKINENENYPKLSGSIIVDSKEYRISIFKNGYKDVPAKPDYNIALTLKDSVQTPKPAPVQKVVEVDDIPF